MARIEARDFPLQAGCVCVERGEIPWAGLHREALSSAPTEPIWQPMLDGRLAWAVQKYPGVAEAFARAYALDSRRIDALLLGGAAWAKAIRAG